MSISSNFSVTVSFGGITATYAGTATGTAAGPVDASVTTGTTNGEYDVTWRAAGLQGWILLAEGGAVTVKTNSTSAPDNTFTLADGSPQFWFTGSGGSDSISTTVTKFYVTNSSGATVRFRAYAVYTNP